MCVQSEVQAVVLVLRWFALVDAHVLGAFETGQELAHSYIELRGVTFTAQGLEGVAKGRGIGEIDSALEACLLKEDFESFLLFIT